MSNFCKLICISFMMFLFQVETYGLDLANNDIEKLVVVYDSKAPQSVSFASSEVERYISKIAKSSVEIFILKDNLSDLKLDNPNFVYISLGRNALSEKYGITYKALRTDGFRLSVKDNFVFIVGNDSHDFDINFCKIPSSAGTLYGVYRFLDELGFRWFYPGEIGEVIPSSSEVKIEEFDITDNPYFRYRFVEGGHREWMRRIGYGGDQEPWASKHTFTSTVNWKDKYSQTHPEYFCLDKNGKPNFYHVAFPHPGVIEEITKQAKDFFMSNRPDGKRRFFSIIPNDYFMSMCTCSACQSFINSNCSDAEMYSFNRASQAVEGFDEDCAPAGLYSDYVCNAVIKVADAIREEFPDCYIVYPAYERYALPPKNVRKLPSNVVVMIAQKRRSKPVMGTGISALELYKRWQALEPAGIYFWRYYTYGKQTSPILLMPRIIAKDIVNMKTVTESGATPILGEMHFRRWSEGAMWWFGINEYVTGKMLWNPDLDVNDILDDYYTKFYGDAASEMKAFFERFEREYSENPDAMIPSIECIEEIEKHLVNASQRVDETIYKERINWVRTSVKPLVEIKNKILSPSNQDSSVSACKPLVEFSFDNIKNSSSLNSKFNFKGSPKLIKAKKGNGLSLDGFSDCIESAISLSNTDYTMMAWIQPITDLQQGTYHIIGSAGYDRISLKIENGVLYLIHRNNSGKKRYSVHCPYDFLANRWYHVAATFSQKNGMCLFIDGQLVSFESNNITPSAWSPKFIGASGRTISKGKTIDMYGYFRGSIDEVVVFPCELSPEKISKYANEN